MTDFADTAPCQHPLEQVTSTVGDDDQLTVHCNPCGTSWVGLDVPYNLIIGLALATTDDFRGVFSASDVTGHLAQQVRQDLGVGDRDG